MPQHTIEKARRKYNQWVATESLEDYALRYSPSSYRRWSPFLIANTAIGSISFLALEAIGAALLLDFGFTNAFLAIAFASVIIFLCSAPITYYCARYNIDIDLLTRSAGFGYVGSTVTSLIYASFCFIFFALEAAIMAQAFKLYFDLPLYIGYIVSSLVIIPIVFYGVTLINRLHLWTQPIWLILMLVPFYFVLTLEPRAIEFMTQFAGEISGSNEFDPYYFGMATGISLALIAQIGEQVDYLRFMPDKKKSNEFSWWFTVIAAGPGWIVLGFLKQIGGVLLASVAVLTGLALMDAKEPMHMYTIAYTYVFDNKELALLVTMIFVVISQIKINVTNAYAGSLAWSNFFSRVTHSHPGRVVWMVFNITIALMLMEMGVFQALAIILGLYSNVAIAWIGAVVADLVINKPFKLSPPMVEFKRAHLFNFNPVGYLSMVIASLIAITAFTGVFGLYAQAYSSLIALSVSFVLSPIIAKITGGKYYIARPNIHYKNSDELETCGICEQQYAQTDFAFCTFYETPICSLCCTLDSNCHDHCKPKKTPFYQKLVFQLLDLMFQNRVSKSTSKRIANFSLTWGGMLILIGITLWLTFSIQTEGLAITVVNTVSSSFFQVYFALALFTSIASWWIVLIHESRELAETELNDQNQILAFEVTERRQAENQATKLASKLQQQTDDLQKSYQELSLANQNLADSVSQGKINKDQIQYLSDLYATLSKINHAIVHITNETELFNELCQITVKFRSLSMAWVGIKRDSDQQIIVIASAGEHLDYLQDINISAYSGVPEGNGPTGVAYRENKIVTANQLTTDCKTKPWLKRVKASHWESSCAIPIPRNNKPFAVLNVYSKIVDYFSDEIIQLLTELGSDLTFALNAFDREIARKKAEKGLELSAKVFAQSQEGIIISDCNDIVVSVNSAYTKIMGYSSEEVVGEKQMLHSSVHQNHDFYQAIWQEINTNNYWQGEIWDRRKNSEVYPQWMTISAVKDDQNKVINYITIFSDISRHKESEAQIEHMAHYDPFTNLPNRILLKAHVDHELVVSERNHSQFALLFLDWDHFKNINDSLGHSIGDKLLITVAQRLKSVVREEDTVSRLGGDEFNILLPKTDFKGAALVAEKVVKVMTETIHIERNHLHITASIGIGLYPDNGLDYETLYKNADTALYQAKEKGRNQYQFFTRKMQILTMRRMEIESHLRHAIARNELVLFYQPQIDAKTKKIIGAEALLRWKHPQWGKVSPAEFIPVAEDTGLIISIGDWVLEQAITQAKTWHDLGYNQITIAVNLSLAQFNENVLFEKVKALLEQIELPPHYLELELTESIAMKNADAAIEITQQLAGLGIQLSIDDFGTGYSSLSYLQRFALHKLKIDQSFSSKMVENKETENIVNAIISLAKSLNLKTIAEGVETAEQLDMLIKKGCDEIQGYYYSQAVPADEFTKLLEHSFNN
jgi:diguanylate cyclase (GGDEF)-like protein/PAS domain S-box-containing protein